MSSEHSRAGRWVSLVALAAIATLVLACNDRSAPPKWDAASVGKSISSAPFTPVIANSNLGRGPTRLAVALFQKDSTLVLQAEVSARLFRLDNQPEQHPDTATERGTYRFTARTVDTADHGAMRFDRDAAGRTYADVALRAPSTAEPAAPAHDGALATIFTSMVDLNEAGMWSAQIDVKTGGKEYRSLLVTFAVSERTAEPAVGEPAPRTVQKLAKDVANLAEIDSSKTPNPELHSITVADAIASGKPSVIAFVTPAFCQTRYCGPVMQTIVTPLHQQYRDRAHVIHIEPYDVALARRGTLTAVPATGEWNLRSEPFIAVLDRQGRVTAKFEGIIDLDEVKQALEAALAAK